LKKEGLILKMKKTKQLSCQKIIPRVAEFQQSKDGFEVNFEATLNLLENKSPS
jgi:hypothetical protein